MSTSKRLRDEKPCGDPEEGRPEEQFQILRPLGSNRWRLGILLAFAACSLLPVLNASAFSLSTQKIELISGKAGDLTYKNDTQRSEQILVDTALCPTLRVYPKVFEVTPGEYQEVRLLSREAASCRLYFMVTPAYADDEKVQIRINFKIGVPVNVIKKGGGE